jgi:hypothetical protein
MSKNLKTTGIFFFITIFVLAVTAVGSTNNQIGMMHHNQMMGMMDNMMGQGNHMMMNMDNIIMQRCPGMMGMMNMRGMMMGMNNISQNTKSMMMDEEY